MLEESKGGSSSRPNLDPDAPDEGGEEGEAMEDVNEDDAAMMAMMGVSGFGSTKVCASCLCDIFAHITYNVCRVRRLWATKKVLWTSRSSGHGVNT